LGLRHVIGSTGDTSERAAQALFDAPDEALLDMGDFAGGMLKYLAQHPVERVTLAGGIGKLTKLAQGALDLHSSRSQVDVSFLQELAAEDRIDWSSVDSAAQALLACEAQGIAIGDRVAALAQAKAQSLLPDATAVDIVIFDRTGRLVGRADPR
jgi:cobalt-precorrin-5B (C1)-methyltransferase